MDIHAGPEVVERAATPYIGLREVTPFRGMVSRTDVLLKQLRAWCVEQGIAPTGPAFLRLHVIDMRGLMDLAVGIPVDHSDLAQASGTDKITDTLLAGRYATLTYNNHAIRANGYLIDWCHDNGLEFDRKDVPAGDQFACRYEVFLSDPKEQPRKTLQHVELNFKLRDV